MLPAMNITPMKPPNQAHQGCAVATVKLGTSSPVAKSAITDETTAATTNERKVAAIGEPTLTRRRVLTAVWTGTMAPTSMARTRNK